MNRVSIGSDNGLSPLKTIFCEIIAILSGGGLKLIPNLKIRFPDVFRYLYNLHSCYVAPPPVMLPSSPSSPAPPPVTLGSVNRNFGHLGRTSRPQGQPPGNRLPHCNISHPPTIKQTPEVLKYRGRGLFHKVYGHTIKQTCENYFAVILFQWSNQVIICTCHDSLTVVACKKMLPDRIIILHVTGARKFIGFSMMTSSNGNIFRVTGHLCGEFTGPRWIPRTKASDAELWCFLWSASE